MAFGLAGTHGAGKSTLAKALAEKLNLTFYDGSCGRIMAELGYNSVANMELPRRIEAQTAYLERYAEEVRGLRELFITDRTPLDMAAYMLGEITMHTPAEHSDAVCEYVGACVSTAAELFETIVVVRPFGITEVREGKPPVNEAFRWGVQYSIEGLMNELRDFIYVQRMLIDDPDDRVVALTRVFNSRIQSMYAKLAGETRH